VTVGLRAKDLERIGRRRSKGGTLQDLAQSFNFGRGPIGEIGDGAVVDLTVLPEGLSEENGGRGVAIGHNRYVHVDMITQEALTCKEKRCIYMTTIM
jgi:hypothetical protein